MGGGDEEAVVSPSGGRQSGRLRDRLPQEAVDRAFEGVVAGLLEQRLDLLANGVWPHAPLLGELVTREPARAELEQLDLGVAQVEVLLPALERELDAAFAGVLAPADLVGERGEVLRIERLQEVAGPLLQRAPDGLVLGAR